MVLGAGAAGLSAAWDLVRHGRQVVVIDRESLPGGLCRTHERDGYRFDLGGHRFISRSPKLTAMVRDLLGDDLLTATRKSVIKLNGRSYNYPLEPLNLLRNLDPMLGARGLLDYALRRPPCASSTADTSFREWTLARYGQTFYDLFFGPYTEKLWGIPAERLSGDWASQRLSLLDLTDVVLRLLRLRRSDTRTYARRYLYPRRGIGQIFTAMAEAVVASGGVYHAETHLVGFETHGGRVHEVIVEQRGNTFSVPCDDVLSTIPLPDLARLLHPDDAAVQRATDQLRFRGVRFINILLDRPEVSDNTWMYVPDGRCLFTRVQEPKRRSPESVPAGKTSLMLEIPCDPGDPIWEQPDDTLLDRCLRDLALLDIDVAAQVRGVFSTRVEHGYPLLELGYRAPRDQLLDTIRASDNVTTCGRQGTFRYIFMDTAMQMGELAAQKLRERRGDDGAIVSLHGEVTLLETQALTA